MQHKLLIGIVAIIVTGIIGTTAILAANLTGPEQSTTPDVQLTEKTNAPHDTLPDEVPEPENITGATDFINDFVLPYIGERAKKTEELLTHSYQVMDAYLIGVSFSEGQGNFHINPGQMENILKANYNTFKEMYADELERGLAAEKEFETYTDGPFPWSHYDDRYLLQAVVSIDEAYKGAIDNVNWSNTESSREPDEPGIDEKMEHERIRDWRTDTRFMKARDVFQRYATWFFGGELKVDGVRTTRDTQ